MDLGKNNKTQFANDARHYASEANLSERHLSEQITNISGFFIALISGLLVIGTLSNKYIQTILIVALILFVGTLIVGIFYIYSVKRYLEFASNIFNTCEEIWSNIVRTKKQYNHLNKKSGKTLNQIELKYPDKLLKIQFVLLILGLTVSLYAVINFIY